ncbi:MAG: metal ABC transporter ATP-binding protein [Chlorobiales bacterium]|nr:metal ABC transporter ATP-binding protein [Chlorobiales bacterium]
MLENAITMKDVSIGYDGTSVLSGLNLTLPQGASLALVGSNGSGKSTLLKTLAGLLPAIKGRVEVFGDKPGLQPLRVSYHGQFHPNSFLLPLRSIDVVRMARFPVRGLLGRFTKEDDDIVQESLAYVHALELSEKPVNVLSGGQKQRVFLSHTLARKADLLLLDEPTAGLDVNGADLYEKLIRRLKAEGKTLLVATHSIKEASQCDYVLLLASRVVAFGNPAQVLTPENIIDTFGIVARFGGNDLLIMDNQHGPCTGVT